mmetsp:Transcript_20468/g.34261  ORF Transcript_20468/g.34261 Transcript_20468/m.34261 type:complete len:221 (+) Transcript_20468:98-760(+)|eukprot:CAMPEP_0174963662 /NCGR_PEP_ID=MMETSP0004_2-20121128/5451_1 /TAXON_ID=420556 /ORGANISM="Ochromonas sp., Strain CCMP1393" /LENGTH=220 /DNA_ID=CAMNT_0016212305 /DNA_START=220 /DNA_END=882 /DNA_ORIENTATION=+
MKSTEEKIKIAGDMVKSHGAKFPGVPLISTQSIIELRKKARTNNTETDPILIDVRSEQEQKASMIPGAITQSEFEANMDLDELRANDSIHIIPYCTIGVRSGRYGLRLQKAGFKRVLNGEGILLWSLTADTSASPNPDQALIRRVINPSVSTNSAYGEVAADSVHVFNDTHDLIDNEKYKSIKFSTWDILMYVGGCWWTKAFDVDYAVPVKTKSRKPDQT